MYLSIPLDDLVKNPEQYLPKTPWEKLHWLESYLHTHLTKTEPKQAFGGREHLLQTPINSTCTCISSVLTYILQDPAMNDVLGIPQKLKWKIDLKF